MLLSVETDMWKSFGKKLLSSELLVVAIIEVSYDDRTTILFVA